MSLVRLIYASRFCSSKYDPSELAKIHESALKNNSGLNVTGALVFGNDHFLQCIEGESEAVNDLYRKISRDPRHDRPTLLGYEHISERSFVDWSMKMVMLTEKKLSLVKRFSTKTDFDPLRMDPKSAFLFLLAI
jgi:hypothetical protein